MCAHVHWLTLKRRNEKERLFYPLLFYPIRVIGRNVGWKIMEVRQSHWVGTRLRLNSACWISDVSEHELRRNGIVLLGEPSWKKLCSAFFHFLFPLPTRGKLSFLRLPHFSRRNPPKVTTDHHDGKKKSKKQQLKQKKQKMTTAGERKHMGKYLLQ